MRDEIEKLINEELDKVPTSLEEVYEPVVEEINANVNLQNEIAKEAGLVLPEEDNKTEKKEEE